MSLFMLNIVLALAWASLTGLFSLPSLLVGFGLGYLALALARQTLGPSTYFNKMQQALSFTAFFVWELLLANLRVAADVLTPRFHMQPRVIAVPLDAYTDVEITLLANLITLTPGTLSLDVSSDRHVLYVHAMYAVDVRAAVHELKNGLERRLLVLLRGVA